MKITSQQWIEVVKLISTFIIGLITALCVQSCTASMSVFWKNSNSQQESKQTNTQSVDSTKVYVQPNF
jgi:flagellar basal body-associated protein FliL